MTIAGLASFVYTTLLKPPPLRWLANRLLLWIIPESVIIAEGNLHLNSHDPVISGALALGVYEPYQLDVFRSHLRPGMTVVDIGANVGLYALIAAKRVGERGRVFAFEPEQENLVLLKKNIRDNHN